MQFGNNKKAHELRVKIEQIAQKCIKAGWQLQIKGRFF